MSWHRRLAAIGLTASLLAIVALLAQPSPTRSQANVICDVGSAPGHAASEIADAVTGGIIGGGNPVGDACNAVTDGAVGAVTSPVTDALKGVGNGIFNQVTSWVAEGATWLIGEVASGIEKTTTPDLTSRGFLAQYGRMAAIASLLAVAMLLFAILEAVAQSSWGILGRAVFVGVPVAFLGTSVAFAIVQMLLVATDQMSHAIAVATDEQSAHFFKRAIKDLGEAGGAVGGFGKEADPVTKAVGEASGSVEVPLFVAFLAAIIGAFAAFFVWIELLMRDAAVYVVALFMPMALAASIWPRWAGALRRTCELLVVIIGSKFVIVSIIALAAGLLGEDAGDVENILAASALMLLACFAPFVLLKLVPFAEGAIGAAYGRRSAAGGAMTGLQLASEAQIIRNMARSNWGGGSPPDVWDVKGGGGNGGADSSGSSGGGPLPGGGRSGGGSGTTGGSSDAAAETAGASAGAGAAAGAAGAAVMAPVAAAKSGGAAAQRLEQSATGQSATGGGERAAEMRGGGGNGEGRDGGEQRSGGSGGAPAPADQPPRPPQDVPAKPSPKEAR